MRHLFSTKVRIILVLAVLLAAGLAVWPAAATRACRRSLSKVPWRLLGQQARP